MTGNCTNSDIKSVESDTAHVLFSTDTLLGCPLECGNARILDFVKVLYTLRHVDQQIGSGRIRTKAPDLPGIGDIPAVLISKNPSTSLKIVPRVDLASFNGLGKLF